jgi:peptidoglycan/LPS O-acetylase OafA/YrhL
LHDDPSWTDYSYYVIKERERSTRVSIRGASGGDRLGHLDYIRVACILYVVAYWHLSGYVKHQGNRYWLGAVMVAALGTFAMISGYLVHRRGWPASSPRFLARRFVRLYPLFAIAVGLFYLWGMIDQPTAVRSLLLVSMIYPPAPVTLWFIVLLLNFDMAYALVAWLRKYRFQWLVYMAIVGGLVLFHLFVHEIDPRLLQYSPAFALGVLVASGILDKKQLLAMAVLVFAVSLALYVTRSLGHTARNIPFLISTSYLVFAIGGALYKPNRLDPAVRLLAYSSYCMYLFHRPVYKSLTRLWIPVSHEMRYIYLLTAGLFLTIAISWVVQTLYDRSVTAVTGAWSRKDLLTAREPE